jgi:hypothetical protein
MLTRFERISALTAAVLAVALWIVGLVVTQALTTGLSDKATDARCSPGSRATRTRFSRAAGSS